MRPLPTISAPPKVATWRRRCIRRTTVIRTISRIECNRILSNRPALLAGAIPLPHQAALRNNILCVNVHIITFNVHSPFTDYISRESKTTRNVLWSRASVCLSVCVTVRGRMPTLLHGPGCNLIGGVVGDAPSCALLGRFAIGARDALLWQHYGNAWQSPAVIRQAQRMPHAPAIKSTRLLRVRRYL